MLIGILIGFFLLPKNCFAVPSKAVIGPITVLGDFPITDRQILFNRFREQLNRGYHLVSHKVLDLIQEQGLASIDIEDCNNSQCVRKILNFTKKIRNQFNAENLFILQIVQSKSETQLSLKLSSLSIPEVTKNIVTENCKKCDLEKLKIKVDRLVKKVFSIIGVKSIAKEELYSGSEVLGKKKESLKLNLKKEKQKHILESEENLKVTEEKTKKIKTLDPYILDRDIYNQQIGNLLIDVTYALQIFRSGMFVLLEVSIDSSGTVVDQKIIKSSGSEDFDETAMMTLEGIQFDPLPESMLKYGNYVVNLQIHNSR